MKQLLFMLLLWASIANGQQMPQYVIQGQYGTACMEIGPFVRTGWKERYQTLYKTSEFPTAPSGFITNLYYKATSTVHDLKYVNLLIKMGYMPVLEGGSTDTFQNWPPLTNWYPTDTVYYNPSFLTGTIDSGDWFRFTLQTPFYYNSSKNFIVDVGFDSVIIDFSNPYDLTSCEHYEPHRCYMYSAVLGGQPIPTAAVPHIGFDIQPDAIGDVSSFKDFSFYPNPSDGRFTVSVNVAQKIHNVQLTVSNITGSVVWQAKYKDIEGAFSHTIDLMQAAKGLYFIELKANNERLMKKLVIQ